VQAATDVLPTPPLPVYRIVRGRINGESNAALLGRDHVSLRYPDASVLNPRTLETDRRRA